MKHQILLYYKYVTIKNPEKFMVEERLRCEKLGLMGRIIVAKEGINGTLEGLKKDTKKYQELLSKKRGFSNIHWKKSEGNGKSFRKLSIKVRSEIVSLSLEKEIKGKYCNSKTAKSNKETDVNPNEVTGIHLAPKELRKWFKKGEKFTIIDMRNDYEHKVGAFEGSVLPPMKNFRDLPKVMPKLSKYKNDKVLTVCTGGVRCEKASGYLIKKGFKDVYQLDGGIVSYMEKYPGDHFKGALYVFDGRVTMAFDPKIGKREIIGHCQKCNKSTEHYADCTNSRCRTQLLCCPVCVKKDKAFCSDKCVIYVKKHPEVRSSSIYKSVL